VSNQGGSPSFNSKNEINGEFWMGAAYESGYSQIDFGRKLKDVIDRRFLLIWLASFIVHFSTALYFSINPPNPQFHRSEIDRIQKQFATLVLEKEIEIEPAEPENIVTDNAASEGTQFSSNINSGRLIESQGGSQSEAAGETTGENLVESEGFGNVSGSDKRRASREQISQEVSSKGLLGLLTGSGSNTQGETVSDVLGEAANTQNNFDKVMGDLDGLKKAGKSAPGSALNQGTGRRIQKGNRSTAGGGIDSLVSGKQQVESTDIRRKGNIVVEKVSSIADERGIKSESRDPDKVSEVINRHNSSIQYCYQRELKQNPDIRGKLVVRFTVTPAGKVRDVKIISSTLNNARIERCVITRIKRWDDFGQIDSSQGDASFRQVYTFGY